MSLTSRPRSSAFAVARANSRDQLHSPILHLSSDTIELLVSETAGMSFPGERVLGPVPEGLIATSIFSPSASILRNHVAFYAIAMDACFVDGERVSPQSSGFYGGWITSAVAGPFKGGPGSRFW